MSPRPSSPSSTPCRSATARRRATASSTPSRVSTEARLTDCIGDPAVEVGGELCVLTVDEVEDELVVALRSGQPRVYDADGLAPACDERFGDLAHDAPANRRVA